MKDQDRKYYLAEELSNTFTHALGGYLGSAAVVLLVVAAVRSGEQVPWKIVSGSIFAASVILLYSASTIYHAVRDQGMKVIMRAVDQMAIYLLIAGSYTPFCLVTLRTELPILAWTIFGFVWGMTLIGILFRLFARHKKYKIITTATYLVMGWAGILILKPLWDIFPLPGIVWLVLGGLLYTLGVLFYLWRSIPFHHTIWHVFVLAGTTCHFFCILFYVMM